MNIFKRFSLAILFCLVLSSNGFSQCENTLPTVMADLSSSPTASATITIGGTNSGKCCDAQFGDPNCQVIQLNLHPSVQGLNISVSNIDDCSIVIYEAADCPLGFGLGVCGQICTTQSSLEYLVCKDGDFEETTLTINSTDCCLGIPFSQSTACEGDDIILRSTASNDVQHSWYTEDPDNDPTSLISMEPNVTVSGLQVGVHVFWLVLENDDCTTAAMPLSIEIFPLPEASVIQGGGECGEDIILNATVTPPEDYVYLWSGPNGFFSTEQNPIIANPNPENEGIYTLNVFNDGGCSSPSVSITLENLSNFNVELDIFITSLSACIGSDLTFFTDFVAGDNVQYIWTHIDLMGQQEIFTTTGPTFTINNITEDDNGVYSVFATDGNCQTDPSALLEIEVQNVLDQINIQGETTLCEGQSLNLNADVIPNAIYNWSGPSGFSSEDPSFTIDDITTANAGTYTLEIFLNNCPSEPTSVEVEILTGFTDETTLFSTSLFVCEGDVLTLFTNFVNGDDITYNWTHINLLGQTEMFTTTEPTLVFDPVSQDQNGVYTVFASQGSCESEQAPLLEIEVQEAIDLPSIDGNTNLCEGETLALSTEEIMGATYSWTGPNGFTSTASSFELKNASQAVSGTYNLEVTLNGCISEINSVEVTILTGIVQTLTISSTSLTTCEGETLTLFTDFIDGSNVIYTWTMINLMGQTEMFQTTEPLLSFNAVTTAQSGVYTVFVSVGSCESEPAALLEIEIQATPADPIIDGDTELCEGEDLLLSAQTITDATYLWTGPNNFSSTDSSISIEDITSEISGLYTLQIFVSGCASAETSVSVSLNPSPPPFTASNDGPYCDGEDVNLFALGADLSLTYRWFDLDTGEFLGEGAILVLPEENVSDGQIFYVVVSNAAGCTYDPIAANNEDGQTTVSYITTPLQAAEAGLDGISCDGSFDLNAIPIQPTGSLFGFWSSEDPEIEFENSLEATTTATNLATGENIIVWQLDDGICGIISSDTLRITLVDEAVAENDLFTTTASTTINIDPLTNDTFTTGDFEITSVSTFAGGTATINSDGTIDFTPDAGFRGQVNFSYTLCSVECPDVCAEAIVRIDVEGTDECIIPTVITPNGDNLNDSFTIHCLTSFPGSALTIFNRWGEKVFETEDYQNDWIGTYKNEVLPAGTYFYVLEINDEQNDPQNGYIYIQRN